MSGLESLVTQVSTVDAPRPLSPRNPGLNGGPAQTPTSSTGTTSANSRLITAERDRPWYATCLDFFCCRSCRTNTPSPAPAPRNPRQDQQLNPISQNNTSSSTNTNGSTTTNNNNDTRLVVTPSLHGHPPLPNAPLLPPFPPGQYKKTLVLDLDETLIHSSFRPIHDAQFQIEISLDDDRHAPVFVRKRPYVDEFLRHVAKKWEVVVFTASMSKYADPLLDKLDVDRVVSSRLFRESCIVHFGNYVKDLSQLGRRLEHTVIIDNSPISYMFQPDHAIPIPTWLDDPNDHQLRDIIPLLDELAECDDVTEVMKRAQIHFATGCYVPPNPPQSRELLVAEEDDEQ